MHQPPTTNNQGLAPPTCFALAQCCLLSLVTITTCLLLTVLVYVLSVNSFNNHLLLYVSSRITQQLWGMDTTSPSTTVVAPTFSSLRPTNTQPSCPSPFPPPGRYATTNIHPTNIQDLGKSSSDLLLKDYPINGTSLEVKTLTPSNVTFKVAGNRDSKSNVITGDMEGKYVDFKNGLTVTQVGILNGSFGLDCGQTFQSTVHSGKVQCGRI